MKEKANTTQVVKCAWQKGDVVCIKVCNEERSVNLGGTTTEFLSGTWCVMCSKEGVRRWELHG